MAMHGEKPFVHVSDSNGNPIVGAKLYVYEVGTTTERSIYSNEGLSVALDNPLDGVNASDASGNFPRFYQATGTYKLRAETSASVLIWEYDNIDTGLPAGTGALPISRGGTGSTTAAAARAALDVPSNSELTDLATQITNLQVAAGVLMLNGIITEADSSNAVTYALKTKAGLDPTPSDPVQIFFRSSTLSSGVYAQRTITAALSIVVSAGSTLGFTNATPGKVRVVAFDDGGTVRLGVINCLSGTTLLRIKSTGIASALLEDGTSGSSDSAFVFYSTAVITSKAYTLLATMNYEAGLTTAGSWNVAPTEIQLYWPGTPLPGDIIQQIPYLTLTVLTGANATGVPNDNSKPQSNEGDQFFSGALVPTSAANLQEVDYTAHITAAGNVTVASSLFQDSGADALATVSTTIPTSGYNAIHHFKYSALCATTTSRTLKIRCGNESNGTVTTVNGTGGAQRYGGVVPSGFFVREIMT
jgi:hypothetical protein